MGNFEYADLEKRLGFDFENQSILERALRHGSSTASTKHGSYQRLEFLGDAVLGHAVAMMLFESFPEDDQGGLTQKRAHLICSSSLAAKAELLGLESFIELGPSVESALGREREALLEDVFEAVLGAIAVDGGWQAAEDFVRRQFEADVDDLNERTLALANPKSALQEVAQGRGLPLPEYREVSASGPDHNRSWVYQVIWDGEEIASAEGRTKREAQQRAARRALIRLGLVPEE